MSPFVSRNAVNGSCIARFPEEILHRILSYSVSVPPAPLLRPSWHVRQKSCNRSRTATLLVCKSWLRIATPLFYKHILLQSEEQAALLSHTVTANPILARYARSLKVMGVWGVLRDVIKLCSSVESLDLTLDAPRIVDTDCRMQEIGKALSDLELLDIRHFVLRKLPNAYITQQKPRFVISHLSLLVPKWQRLEFVHIAFPLSAQGDTLALATALASSPRLTVLRTQLPVVWSPVLLTISKNPHMDKIELWNMFCTDDKAMVGTGLFLKEARKHQRLVDLIKAGTHITRMRAHTVASMFPIRTEDHRVTLPSPASLHHDLYLHS